MTVFAATGIIEGGWGYIGAAYGITWAVFLGYALSLWIRRPRAGEEDR